MPSDVDDQDYIEFLEIMKARSRDDRPVDPETAFKKMMKMQ